MAITYIHGIVSTLDRSIMFTNNMDSNPTSMSKESTILVGHLSYFNVKLIFISSDMPSFLYVHTKRMVT